VISSDNDKAFVNDILNEVARSWRIDKRTITPYHPRANGFAERNVGVAKDTLKRLVDDVRKWVRLRGKKCYIILSPFSHA